MTELVLTPPEPREIRRRGELGPRTPKGRLSRKGMPNPMLVFGPGPAGTTCRDCRFLHAYEQMRVWYKCDLRMHGGPATDHRVRWPSCAKFEAKP